MMHNRLPSTYNVEVDRLAPNTWSALLREFHDATIYQTWSYGETMYGADNLSHLVVKKGKQIVAAAQVGVRHFPIPGFATANVHWGPLWQTKIYDFSREDLFAALTALKIEYCDNRRHLMRLWLPEYDRSDGKAKEELKSLGFRQNAVFRPYRTLIVDLKPSLDEIRKNLGQKWRYHLNKAERTDLYVTEGTSAELYETFLRLQREMQTRKGYVAGVSYGQYGRIQRGLADSEKMRIAVCRYEEQPVSVAICSALGNTGIYMLGATGNAGLKVYGSNLLHWRMIRWLKEKGCSFYDLGGIDPEANPGVYRFKRGIAGKTARDVSHIGEFDCWTSVQGRFLNIVITNGVWRVIRHRRRLLKKRMIADGGDEE